MNELVLQNGKGNDVTTSLIVAEVFWRYIMLQFDVNKFQSATKNIYTYLTIE